MPELSFAVESANPVRPAAEPIMGFRVLISELASEPTPIHSVVLRCQVRIEPARRKYGGREQDRLLDLFGTPDRWGKTVRDMLWTHVTAVVPPFTGETTVELPVPCSFDFTLAATKYYDALEGGDIPLIFLFSGTVFYAGEGGELQVVQIPWDREAKFRLAVNDWKNLTDLYYPNTAWLALRKDVFDRLHRFKSRHGLPTWEQALDALLAAAGEAVTP
ncbi:MAG: hypothetical protein JWO38_1359 [Gemmataceae bacterium]|nr:hypothetical protein [Gemmataceae bacterium]